LAGLIDFDLFCAFGIARNQSFGHSAAIATANSVVQPRGQTKTLLPCACRKAAKFKPGHRKVAMSVETKVSIACGWLLNDGQTISNPVVPAGFRKLRIIVMPDSV
jgi:hypothetical protein